MKKTISISLGGMEHTLEEDAYQRLEQYINKLKTHFQEQKDADEIITDIESRLSEQLLQAPGQGKIVTIKNIADIITTMGQPEDFGEGEAKQYSNTRTDSPATKRLFRDPDNTIVAGVASGLAAYFGIDPVWLRLVFGLSLLAGGFGFAVYIILWIIVPEAKTETEKMQMRGEPINLANIVKERVEEIKKKDHSNITQGAVGFFEKLGKLVETVARSLGKVVKTFGQIVIAIIGTAISIGAAITIIGLIVGVISILLNANSTYIDFPFRELAHSWFYYPTILSTFFVALIPLLFLLLLGTSMLAKRSTITKGVSFSLLGLWVVALILAINGAFHFAPQIQQIIETSPYFKTTTKELNLKDFTNIELTGATRAILHKSDTYKVTATGTQRDLDENRVVIENNTLVTSHEKLFNFCIFCGVKPITLDIYLPEIEYIELTGASHLAGEVWGANNSITLSGASRTNITSNTDSLDLKLSGASRAEVQGVALNLNTKLSGASRVLGRAMKTNYVTAELSGASKLELAEIQILNVKASGASTVIYVRAGEVTQRLSGSSKLIKTGSSTQNQSENYDYNLPPKPTQPIEPIEQMSPIDN